MGLNLQLNNITSEFPFVVTPEFPISLSRIVSINIVDVESPTTNEDGTPSNFEFAGTTTKQFQIKYQQIDTETMKPVEKYYTQIEKFIVRVKNAGETNESFSKLMIGEIQRLSHFTEVVLKVVNKTLDVADVNAILTKLDFSMEDSVESYIDKHSKLFDFFFNQIKDIKLDGVYFWFKLVAAYKDGTYLEIPSYIKQGYLELYKQGVATNLFIGASESITLLKKEVKGSQNQVSAIGTGNVGNSDAAKTSSLVASLLGKQ